MAPRRSRTTSEVRGAFAHAQPRARVAVVVTLALGIGANAAIFSVLRGVLLRPLVNHDEDRLIYIRQSAPGLGACEHDVLGARNRRFQVRATALTAFGDFSTIVFRWSALASRAW